MDTYQIKTQNTPDDYWLVWQEAMREINDCV
jgi:hypothetical protein